MSWYPAAVTVAPVGEPVTIEEARVQTRWDDSPANDAALAIYIASARARVEDCCGTPLSTRTIEVKCDTFADFAAFPVVPVQSISSISYVDGAGGAQSLSSDVYELVAARLDASIKLRSGEVWPQVKSGSRITVVAVVGYAAIPPDIRHEILRLVSHADNDREDGAAVDALALVNHRVY